MSGGGSVWKEENFSSENDDKNVKISTDLGERIHSVLFLKQYEKPKIDFQAHSIKISNNRFQILPKLKSKKDTSQEDSEILFENCFSDAEIAAKLFHFRNQSKSTQYSNEIQDIFEEDEEFELDLTNRIIDPNISSIKKSLISQTDDPFSWKREESKTNLLLNADAYGEDVDAEEDELCTSFTGKRNYRKEGTQRAEEFSKIQKLMRDNYNQEI